MQLVSYILITVFIIQCFGVCDGDKIKDFSKCKTVLKVFSFFTLNYFSLV